MKRSVQGFNEFRFEHMGVAHQVLKKGDGSQPGVLIIQELPGITRHTIELAQRLHRDGFTIYIPVLFGKPNCSFEPIKNLARVCISNEFRLMANRRRGPVSDWLRALCRKMQAECGGQPVGAIGMCLTGGFVLTLMIDESVAAPVACQPAHIDGMVGGSARASLGIPESDIDAAVARSERDGIPLMGLRFTNDVMCPNARFDYLQSLLGDRFQRIDIDSSLFNGNGISPIAHSVLTIDYVDRPDHPTRQAYEQVIDFLRKQLT